MDNFPLIAPERIHLQIGGDLDSPAVFAPRDPDGCRAVGECIGRHHNLRMLTLRGLGPTLPALLMGVSKNRSVSELMFYDCSGDWPLEILGEFFEKNQNLSLLRVIDSNFSPKALLSLSVALRNCTTCQLEDIWWSSSPMGDDGPASEFIASLAGLSKLKNLRLVRCDVGQRVCSGVAALLRKSTCALQSVNLCCNDIGKEGLAALKSGIVANSTLTDLWLVRTGEITTASWHSFVGVLRGQACLLKHLDFRHNGTINDDVMVALADTLSSNDKLEELWLGGNNNISNVGWAALSRSLYNQSSINAMHSSNHTLWWITGIGKPSDLDSYLRLNECPNKSAVAQKKILIQFFGLNFSMEPFNENNMGLNILPHLLSWIGKLFSAECLGISFDFVRRMPSLCGIRCCELRRGTRKRKAQSRWA